MQESTLNLALLMSGAEIPTVILNVSNAKCDPCGLECFGECRTQPVKQKNTKSTTDPMAEKTLWQKNGLGQNEQTEIMEIDINYETILSPRMKSATQDRHWPDRPYPKIGIGLTEQTLATLGQTKQTLTTIGQTEQTFSRPLARPNRTMARPLSRPSARSLCRPSARPLSIPLAWPNRLLARPFSPDQNMGIGQTEQTEIWVLARSNRPKLPLARR